MSYESPEGLPVDISIFTITTEKLKKTRKSLPKRDLKVLLIKRKTFSEKREDYPYQGYWALPGGFSKKEETIDEAALRELREETNVKGEVHIEQLKTIYYPGRDPRGWIPTVIYYSLLHESMLENLKAETDAEDVGLFSLDQVETMELAFDHKDIIKEAYEEIKTKMMNTNIAKEFLEEEFTISELLQVIQTVVPEFSMEKSNFIRRLTGTKSRKGLIEKAVDENGEERKSAEYSNVQAQLYRFTDLEPKLSIYNSNIG